MIFILFWSRMGGCKCWLEIQLYCTCLARHCYTRVETKRNLSTQSKLSACGTIQKHVKGNQTLAPLAIDLIHVIALAMHPPCITSHATSSSFINGYELTKAWSCLCCQRYSVQKNGNTDYFPFTNDSLKSLIGGQAVLALVQKLLYIICCCIVCDLEGFQRWKRQNFVSC